MAVLSLVPRCKTCPVCLTLADELFNCEICGGSWCGRPYCTPCCILEPMEGEEDFIHPRLDMVAPIRTLRKVTSALALGAILLLSHASSVRAINAVFMHRHEQTVRRRRLERNDGEPNDQEKGNGPHTAARPVNGECSKSGLCGVGQLDAA